MHSTPADPPQATGFVSPGPKDALTAGERREPAPGSPGAAQSPQSDGLTGWWSSVPDPVQKVAVGAAGGVLVVAGGAMMVLPGPGIAVLVLGLAVLATEFAWAHTARHRLLEAVKNAVARTKGLLHGR